MQRRLFQNLEPTQIAPVPPIEVAEQPVAGAAVGVLSEALDSPADQ